MKTLDVPFIEGLAEMDDAAFLRALEEGGARFSVDQVGWPDDWPYCPETQGAIAHCNDGLAIRFHVRGFDLRAENLSDNGRQWEDSCCEFFVAGPAGYYNFEINCIGKILGAMGPQREERTRQEPKALERIRRVTSLPVAPVDRSGEICTWDVAVLIPYDLFGAVPNTVSLRANFYKCGDLTAHPHFVSWAPVNSPKPDFHRPDSFGELILLP